jgi:hypothetical protein
LNTQKEILKQFEQSKKEYIMRLKRELETVEERFVKIINQNTMISEDYRSQAYLNFNKLVNVRMNLRDKCEELDYSASQIKEIQEQLKVQHQEHQNNLMVIEDQLCQIVYRQENIDKLDK